jgi:hypothetical protein
MPFRFPPPPQLSLSNSGVCASWNCEAQSRICADPNLYRNEGEEKNRMTDQLIDTRRSRRVGVQLLIAYGLALSVIALKKGARRLTREEVAAMAAVQNMIAFPPAPKLNVHGRLDASKASDARRRVSCGI